MHNGDRFSFDDVLEELRKKFKGTKPDDFLRLVISRAEIFHKSLLDGMKKRQVGAPPDSIQIDLWSQMVVFAYVMHTQALRSTNTDLVPALADVARAAVRKVEARRTAKAKPEGKAPATQEPPCKMTSRKK